MNLFNIAQVCSNGFYIDGRFLISLINVLLV